MGRRGDGVEIHGSAIRLSFTLDGERKRQLLMIDGKPLSPTAANMKYARRVAQEIRERIRHGTFSMAEYFPASGSAGGELKVKGWLETWLGTQGVEKSTKAGYDSAVNFWGNAAAVVERETQAVQATVGSLALRVAVSQI